MDDFLDKEVMFLLSVESYYQITEVTFGSQSKNVSRGYWHRLDTHQWCPGHVYV